MIARANFSDCRVYVLFESRKLACVCVNNILHLKHLRSGYAISYGEHINQKYSFAICSSTWQQNAPCAARTRDLSNLSK